MGFLLQSIYISDKCQSVDVVDTQWFSIDDTVIWPTYVAATICYEWISLYGMIGNNNL